VAPATELCEYSIRIEKECSAMSLYIVKASFDAEAEVWFVDHTDIPGLATEAATFEALCQKIEIIAAELLEANGLETGAVDVAIEIIAHTTAKLSLTAA
jgi:predicted RNase H-like HicB family nuclease